MKFLKDIIQEKLIINKNSRSKTYIKLSEDNIKLLQKVFKFYLEYFLSEETIKRISKKNKIDDERYYYTLDEINDTIASAERENRSVASILFNNEFKDKEEVKQITDLFINIPNETDKLFKEKVKEELLNAFKTFKCWKS